MEGHKHWHVTRREEHYVGRLRWCRHAMRREEDHVGRRAMGVEVHGKRKRGRSERRWLDSVGGRSGMEVNVIVRGAKVNRKKQEIKFHWTLLTLIISVGTIHRCIDVSRYLTRDSYGDILQESRNPRSCNIPALFFWTSHKYNCLLIQRA